MVKAVAVMSIYEHGLVKNVTRLHSLQETSLQTDDISDQCSTQSFKYVHKQVDLQCEYKKLFSWCIKYLIFLTE